MQRKAQVDFHINEKLIKSYSYVVVFMNFHKDVRVRKSAFSDEMDI